MGSVCLHITAIALCLFILITVEVNIISPSLQNGTLVSRLISYHPSYKIIIDDGGNLSTSNKKALSEEVSIKETNPNTGFTVIIVTYNEPLLYKT